MLKLLFTRAVLLIVGISLFSCAEPKAEITISKGPHAKNYIVKGDPMELLAGAKMNPQSPFRNEDMPNFEDYQLSGLISFAEKAKVSTSSGQEKKNTEASNDTTEINFRKITVTQTSWNTWSLGLIGNSAFLNFETDSKGYVQLKQAQENGSLSLLTPLHWSISSDRAMISILFSVMDEERGLTLQAIYFEKRLKKPVAAKRVNTRYVYIRGDGLAIGWSKKKNETLKIEYCGSVPQERDLTQDAVQKWKKPLAGRLNIQFNHAKVYAPFSDLNQHCLYVSKAYIFSEEDNASVYGVTISQIHSQAQKYVDADIFIFEKDFEKMKNLFISVGHSPVDAEKMISNDRVVTYVHELGHLLGLGHKFDRTKSTMSYDYDSTRPTKYDIEAIHNLYPLY